MRRFAVFLFVVISFLAAVPQARAAEPAWETREHRAQAHAAEPVWETRENWAQVFEAAKVHGTMLMYDEQAGRYFVHDLQRARRGFIPASTFKLFNSLVALEEKAVADEYETLRWDGVERPQQGWNRDNSLASSMKYSVVWFHQEMARRTGKARMAHWITASNYGNANIEGRTDGFWLDGALRISAEQQITFLRKLADGTQPFSAATQETVRRIALIEDGVGYHLHGKTGWGGADSSEDGAAIGWWTGWVERDGRRWFFAINIDIRKDADGNQRKHVARKILEMEGALPKAQTR